MTPESSKQGKKRGKKQKRALEVALMNNLNVGVRINEEHGSNVSANQKREISKKQKRTDKTTCIEREDSNVPPTTPVATPTESRARMSIASNDTRGTTRTRGPTRHVPNESKEYYWQAVKKKFTFKEEDEEDAKAYVLQKMGCLARSKKSKLGSNMKKKPDYIDQSEWELFVKMRSTKKWKEKGPCPKEKVRLRAWVHGYSNKKGGEENTEDDELIKKAKEILRAPSSEGSPQSGVNDDALSHVVTQPERRGRLRGAGAGASASKSALQAKYSAQIIVLEKTVESLKGNIDSLSTLVEKQAKLISSLMRNQSHNGSNSHLLKGKCKLFNWKNSQELVAIGILSSDDPNEVVHGKPLGEGVSRVWVEMVYQPKAPLFRPCFDNAVIEDVIGSTTAWPTINIMMIE